MKKKLKRLWNKELFKVFGKVIHVKQIPPIVVSLGIFLVTVFSMVA